MPIASAWDDVTGFFSDAIDVAGEVFDTLPVAQPMKDLVNGPLRDFARTPYGKIVLRAMTTMWYGPIAWTIGPQLGAVIFAFPGILRGERFDEAWMLEFKWRVEKTAETLGPGILEMFGDQIKEALLTIGEEIGVGNMVTEAAESLAARLGIREDVAQFAIDLWNRTGPPGRDAYSFVTGKKLRSAYAAQTILRSAATPAPTAVSTLMLAPNKTAYRSRARASSDFATYDPASDRVEPHKQAGDVLLVGVIAAAAGALAWFYWPKRAR